MRKFISAILLSVLLLSSMACTIGNMTYLTISLDVHSSYIQPFYFRFAIQRDDQRYSYIMYNIMTYNMPPIIVVSNGVLFCGLGDNCYISW